MESNSNSQERAVQVDTAFGIVEGRIRLSSAHRTLDDLNFPGSHYLVIHEPTGSGAESSAPAAAARGPLAIRKESILFVRELEGPPPSMSRAHAEQCWLSVIEYRVGSFLLRGTVHIPPGCEPISRLNQSTHRFLALTAVTVLGSGRSFEAPFLAVNREHVMSARELDGVPEVIAVGE